MIGVERNFGGAEGNRTPDPLHAMQMRYHLRYSPALSPTVLLHSPVATAGRPTNEPN